MEIKPKKENIYKKGGKKFMTKRRVRATSAHAAKKKASGKNTVCSGANYIKGSKKGRMKTYSVTTHKRKK